MEPPDTAPAMRAVWSCPKCGARLVSRNLWHSCGQFTLEALFAGAAPGVLELAREYVAMLQSLGDVQVLAQKTRLVCVARVRFAGLSPRKRGFQAPFALHRWLDNPRIVPLRQRQGQHRPGRRAAGLAPGIARRRRAAGRPATWPAWSDPMRRMR
jgi:hypothetical protein